MTEQHILEVADAFEPKYRQLFNVYASKIAEGYAKLGQRGVTAASMMLQYDLAKLMDKNHLIAVVQGVNTVKVRNRKLKKSITIEDAEDPDQITEIAAKFLKKKRSKDVAETTLNLANQAVAAGISAGMPPQKIARLIKDTVGGDIGAYRSRMIARTETAAAYNYANLEQAKTLEDSTGPLMKIWVAASDERVRDTHAEADGQAVPIDGQFNIGGELMDHPGDPNADASEVINCRCCLVYVPSNS